MRAFGHRKQERAFELAGVGIVKFLVNAGGGDLVFDLVDLRVADLDGIRGRGRHRARRPDARRLVRRRVNPKVRIVDNNEP